MTSADRREMVTVPVDLGTAELIPDPRSLTGWALFVDGVAQSYVDLADPLHLEFAYMRRVANAVDAVRPPRVPIDVLHMGGGALSLPRYIGATRPGSRQRVIELDESLFDLVSERLPLAAGLDVTVEIAGARVAIAAEPAEAYDMIVSDAFVAASMPEDISTTEFVALVAPALRSDGLYVVNVTDMPTLAFTRRLAATVRTAFAEVCVIGDPSMLRGRRFGNCLLVASRRPDGVPTEQLSRIRPDETGPIGLLQGAALDTFIGGANPLTDATVAANTAGLRIVPRFEAAADFEADDDAAEDDELAD